MPPWLKVPIPFRVHHLFVHLRLRIPSLGLASDCGWLTGKPEVIPGQKSASRRWPLISSNPVSGPRDNK
jgi:hypothetical protein